MAQHATRISNSRRRSRGTVDRSLTEQVYDELKREIVTGGLRPSETINEPDLAVRYGISKTPIREALRLLVQDGWVVVLRRKGYLVRPLGLEDIREIFAMRRMLEPPLTAGAARRASTADVAILMEIVARQASQDLEFDQIIDAAADFHIAIVKFSSNSRALKVVTALVEEVTRLMHLMPRLEENLRSVAELEAHEAIAEAIEQRNAEEAADLMGAHLTFAGRGMTQVFGEGTIDDELRAHIDLGASNQRPAGRQLGT